MSWLHAWRQRVRDRLGRSRAERDLQDEITHHLELETARQIRDGHAPDVARARALERFGHPGRIAEAARDERVGSSPEGRMQDLRWAMRSLSKSPGFTVMALLTLTLGIGATTVAFTVLDTVLLRPLPYAEPDQLVFVREVTARHSLRAPSFPNFVSWREQSQAFDAVASTTFPFGRTVSVSTDPALRVTSVGVSRRFFATLGVTPLMGREFTDAENTVGGPNAVMVSYEFWRSRVGGRSSLGTIRLGSAETPVVGVLPAGFQLVAPADIYFPHERQPGTIRSAHAYRVIGRLKPGVSLAAARADMTRLSKALLAAYGTQTEAVDADVRPLLDYVVGDQRLMLTVVFGAAALVLLIACTNLVSAQLARGWTREREVVVRAALGASRGRLVRQLVFESGVLVLLGTLLAAGLAVAATRVIRSLGATLVPRLAELGVDGRVLAFVSAVAVLTALLVGLYPALRLANRDAGDALRAGRTGGTTVRASVWRLLVGFEIALAMVLLVGSALLIRTFHNILTADTGFDPHGIVTAAITPSDEDVARFDEATADLRALPSVSGIAFTSHLPLSWGEASAPVRHPGDPMDHDWPAMAGFRVISPEYFAVLRQPLLRGRAFTPSDRAGAPGVAIVTPGIAAALWPGRDPIGQIILTNWLGDAPLTVVGLVNEATSWTMPRGTQNEIFVPLAQNLNSIDGQLIAMIRTGGDPATLLPLVGAKLRGDLPHSPAQLDTMDGRIASSAASRRFAMLALTAFGVIALVLAVVGIYGVIWYIVTTRTQEIGIRMALGASARRVRRDVVRGAAIMAGGGILAGTAGCIFATRFIESTLYGVSRLDPATFAAGAAIAMLAALGAAWIPAWRSSRVDPLIAIRSD